MTEDEFQALARAGYNRTPLELETLADPDTPLSIYLKLANRRDSYLLESVIGGERFGRYSIVGLPARERLEVRGQHMVLSHDGVVVRSVDGGDPLEHVDEYLRSFRAAPVGPALRFAGGLAGYFGYDTVRCIEKRLGRNDKPDPLGLPEIRLLLSEELAVVDNLSGKLHLIVYADPAVSGAYARAMRRLQELRGLLRTRAELPAHSRGAPQAAPRSNIGERAFYDAVARSKRYITDVAMMQIDLGRNAVGRIARFGSVNVTETMVVERSSHVMHMVSNVEGEVAASLTPMQLLRATFPAGTVTGARKVRSMEVIDEVEPERRGVYAGAAGYLGFNGNIDLAIAIRTGVVKDGTLHVQAAAGIVADSIPENEWRETQSKARALLAAAEQVDAGLDAPLE